MEHIGGISIFVGYKWAGVFPDCLPINPRSSQAVKEGIKMHFLELQLTKLTPPPYSMLVQYKRQLFAHQIVVCIIIFCLIHHVFAD
jgi:hypothetical protein